MERTDWLHAGYDSSQARFLMLTAVTHHNFGSPAWGEGEVRRLYTELTAIEAAVAEALSVNRSSRNGHALPASPLFPATRPVQPRPARRPSRLLGWLRLGSGRDRDSRRDASSANDADRPASSCAD